MIDEKRIITLNGKEYDYEELEDNEKYLVNQITDLSNKINNARFNLDQLQIAHDACSKMLIDSINKPKEEEAEDAA